MKLGTYIDRVRLKHDIVENISSNIIYITCRGILSTY